MTNEQKIELADNLIELFWRGASPQEIGRVAEKIIEMRIIEEADKRSL